MGMIEDTVKRISKDKRIGFKEKYLRLTEKLARWAMINQNCREIAQEMIWKYFILTYMDSRYTVAEEI